MHRRFALLAAICATPSFLVSGVRRTDINHELLLDAEGNGRSSGATRSDIVKYAQELAGNFTSLKADEALIASMLAQHADLARAVKSHFDAKRRHAKTLEMMILKSALLRRARPLLKKKTGDLESVLADKHAFLVEIPDGKNRKWTESFRVRYSCGTWKDVSSCAKGCLKKCEAAANEGSMYSPPDEKKLQELAETFAGKPRVAVQCKSYVEAVEGFCGAPINDFQARAKTVIENKKWHEANGRAGPERMKMTDCVKQTSASESKVLDGLRQGKFWRTSPSDELWCVSD